jgi:hypothetical protein
MIGALQMAAILTALARAFPSISTGDDQLTTVTIFCGLGLLASLVAIFAFGLDLSGGF